MKMVAYGAVVSVGKKGYERQIKNVAAGVILPDSTDANRLPLSYLQVEVRIFRLSMQIGSSTD